MLPIVAAMMMGTMSKQVSRPAGSQAGMPAGAESLIGMLTPMLDSNRDGSIVDDVVGMIGRFSGRQSILTSGSEAGDVMGAVAHQPRRRNRCSFPVAVFGSSGTNSIQRGYL